jgi:hypothetical protein
MNRTPESPFIAPSGIDKRGGALLRVRREEVPMRDAQRQLEPAALRCRYYPDGLPFETTQEVPDLDEVVGQPRAVAAVQFGVGMGRDGYHMPNYSYGQSVHEYEGQIAGFGRRHGTDRFAVSAPIIKGCSGGPLLNRVGQVIGVAVTGEDAPKPNPDAEYGVIRIDALALLMPQPGPSR